MNKCLHILLYALLVCILPAASHAQATLTKRIADGSYLLAELQQEAMPAESTSEGSSSTPTESEAPEDLAPEVAHTTHKKIKKIKKKPKRPIIKKETVAPAQPIAAATEATPVAATQNPPEVTPAVSPSPAESTPPLEPTPPVTKNKPQTTLIVTAHANQGETTLHFPWNDRTAAAVFEHNNAIWIVFSQSTDVNIGLLQTILPKEVGAATQYAYPGNTVLRLTSAGKLHAKLVPASNGYAWDVVLSPTPSPPALNVPIASDTLDAAPRLVLGVFDVAPAVHFYTPDSGEKLTIIPTFENGRGIATMRNFPELQILQSPQGIAILAKRPDINVVANRSGLIIGAADGLNLSKQLPQEEDASTPIADSKLSAVMLPYAQWAIAPNQFQEILKERLAALSSATKETKPKQMMALVKLYFASGMEADALGMLTLIHAQFPDYYVSNKLALLSAAAHVMLRHTDSAAQELLAAELNDLPEAQLWRQVVALEIPPAPPQPDLPSQQNDAAANIKPTTSTEPMATAPKPVEKPEFQFSRFEQPFIRFYPPRIRHRLANIAAQAYLADGQEEKALAVYDTLVHDGSLEKSELNAEITLALVAQKKGETAQALEIFDRLSAQHTDPYIRVQARDGAAFLRYKNATITAEDAAEIIESTRMTWRGDALEQQLLDHLSEIYQTSKRYDDLLRTKKAMLDAFPNSQHSITIAGEMTSLFESIFLDGLADSMPPLKALALFYEFRELTPLGETGDHIIQKLADRLAAVDLLDRATQLLENQIKFRTTGEYRSKIGTRLALLHILNKHPEEALKVLEVTNFGENTDELQLLRRQLTAQALTSLGKYEEALGVLYNDKTLSGAQLRINALWAMKDWPNIVNRAEDYLSARPNLTEPLDATETEMLLKLAIAYCFEGDYTQLRYLRDYYSPLIPDTAYKQIFNFITNDTAPLDPEDFSMLAQQISNTENFLTVFKEKISAGKLSETVK